MKERRGEDQRGDGDIMSQGKRKERIKTAFMDEKKRTDIEASRVYTDKNMENRTRLDSLLDNMDTNKRRIRRQPEV